MNRAMWMDLVTSARRYLLVIESWAAAIFSACMSLFYALMLPMATWASLSKEQGDIGWAICCAMMLFVGILELFAIGWSMDCLRKRLYPVGFSIALMQPQWKWGLRYPISLWWSIKFLSGILILFVLHVGILNEDGPGKDLGIFWPVLFVLIQTHLTFGCLMLALGCYVSRERLARIWTKRFTIELWFIGAAVVLKWIASQH